MSRQVADVPLLYRPGVVVQTVSSGLSFDMPVVLATGAVLGQGCCLPVVFSTTSRYAQCKLCRRRGFHSAVLSWSSTCPLVCKRQGFGPTVEKTVVPQLHSSDKVVNVPGVRVAQILRCRCGGDSRLPQLQPLRIPSRFRACSRTRSLTCLCCAMTGAWSMGAEKLRFSAVAVCDKVWTSL